MKEQEILDIILSHSEPVTMLDGIIHSNDFKDMAREIYEAMNKEEVYSYEDMIQSYTAGELSNHNDTFIEWLKRYK